MKLDSIRLQNFRCFEDFQVNLKDDLNVIVANNGGGKTSLLNAIAIAFGPFLTRIPGVSGRNFSKNDLRVTSNLKRAPFKAIAARLYNDADAIEWSRFERRDKTPRTTAEIEQTIEKSNLENNYNAISSGSRLAQINQFADRFVDSFNQEKPFELPIMAFYGVERNAFAVPERKRAFQKSFTRFDAYHECLEPSTNFRKFLEYFVHLEAKENMEVREKQDFGHRNLELEVIRKAVTTFFTEFSNPRSDISPLRFLIDETKNGVIQTFDIRDLSDGYRTMIGVVMDLASRMAEANPQLGVDALQSKGVVLIDEIDMHLHPSWQQLIIADFRRTFPNIQLICSTHSPQVLSTVANDRIIVIDESLNGSSPSRQTQGLSSSSLLSNVMKVDAIPPVKVSGDLSELRGLIESGSADIKKVKSLREKLEAHFGKGHPALQELNQLAKLQTFKQNLLR